MTNDITNTVFILEIPNGFRDEIYSNKFDRYFNVTGGNLENPHDTQHFWQNFAQNILTLDRN